MQFGVNVNKLFHSLESNLEKVELIIESVQLFCWCCLGNYHSNRNRAIDQRLMSATKNIRVEVKKRVEKAMVTEQCAKPSSIYFSCQFKTRLAKQKCIEHSFNFYFPSSFDAWHSEQFNGPFGSRSFWSGQNDNSGLLKPSWVWEMGDCSNIVCQCQRNCGVGCFTAPYQSHTHNLKSPPAVI